MRVKELKELIQNIDDDFDVEINIIKELTKEERPYPYEYIKAGIELQDIGYSDKIAIYHPTVNFIHTFQIISVFAFHK